MIHLLHLPTPNGWKTTCFLEGPSAVLVSFAAKTGRLRPSGLQAQA